MILCSLICTSPYNCCINNDYYYGETRTESLVGNLEVKLGTSNDVGKDMDLKKNGLMEVGQDQVDRDLVGNQYRGIGNMVGRSIRLIDC